MKFTLHHTDNRTQARIGTVHTDHGAIHTPIFMPVGTNGTVKGVHMHELKDHIKAQIILGNTYHLYLRPGTDTIQQAGGLHRFNNWDLPILTDSGGFQVYSLSDARTLTDNGVTFKSFIDGSMHTFTPESNMDIQRKIGADIIMALDECTPYPCDYKYAAKSLEGTHRWLVRCKDHFDNTEPLYGYSQSLFPIVQGSVYKDLRIKSAEFIASMDFDGNAIGGLSVGEPAEDMYAMTGLVCGILPTHKPRYLMGVGTPWNILECIALGVDMFDCVMPTRNARNGWLFTSKGVVNLTNAKWKNDFSPIDEELDLYTDHLYSKAYVKHLLKCNERLGEMLASLHNLRFYMWLLEQARVHIEMGDFLDWKEKMVPILMKKL